MTYVIDASVALKWVLPENDTDKAERLRNDYLGGHLSLISPEFMALETLHALTRAERQGRIPAGDGGMCWQDILRTAPSFQESLPLAIRAYEIASQERTG